MSRGKPSDETCQTRCNSIPPNSPELYFPEDTLSRALDLYVGGHLPEPPRCSQRSGYRCPAKEGAEGTEGGLNPLPKGLGTSRKGKGSFKGCPAVQVLLLPPPPAGFNLGTRGTFIFSLCQEEAAPPGSPSQTEGWVGITLPFVCL